MTIELDGCIVTVEQTLEELERIEDELVQRLNLPKGRARGRLLALDASGQLGDDELISDWRAAYASLLDWAHADPPRVREKPDCTPSKQEAAQEAASALLCLIIRARPVHCQPNAAGPEAARLA